MAPHSYGAVQGLMASGYVENCGIWADEWVWPCCGFGKLGELIPQEKVWETRRKLGARQCPWVYDIQMWLMGLASGATVFQLEQAHQWGPEGHAAANCTRSKPKATKSLFRTTAATGSCACCRRAPRA